MAAGGVGFFVFLLVVVGLVLGEFLGLKVEVFDGLLVFWTVVENGGEMGSFWGCFPGLCSSVAFFRGFASGRFWIF